MISNQYINITGNINGQDFTGNATGTIDPSSGVSNALVVLYDFPIDTFSPVLCHSWKTKSCPPAVDPVETRPNCIKAMGGEYDMDIDIQFSGAATGSIHTTGETRRTGHLTPVPHGFSTTAFDCTVQNFFEGNYDGPIDAVAVQGHFEVYEPTSIVGVFNVYGHREIVMDDTSIVYANWAGTLTMRFDPAGTRPQASDFFGFENQYAWDSFTWNPGAISTYAKSVTLTSYLL